MKSRNKGILLSYANTVMNMVFGLFLSAYLLRSLGDVEYGIYQTISSFANYLVMLEFGVGTVMTRNISMCKSRNASDQEISDNINTLWLITNILAICIVLISVVFYCCIDDLYGHNLTFSQIKCAKEIFTVITFYLIASFYLQTLKGIALGYERYTFSAKMNVIRMLSRTIILTVLIYYCKSSLLIAITDALIGLCLCIFSYIYCVKNFGIHFSVRKFDYKVFRNSFPLCCALFLQTIINQANNNTDKFLIGVFLDPTKVSLYSVALYIYSVYSSIATVPISMYAPQVSGAIATGTDIEKVTEKVLPAVRLTSFVVGTILFGFISAGRQFIHIVYGPQYDPSWMIAVLLCASSYPNLLTGVLINILDAKNKRGVRSGLLLITTVANFVLTIWGLQYWGIYGAVAATCVCTLIGQVLLMGLYYSHALKIRVLYLYHKALHGILPFQLLGTVVALVLRRHIPHMWISFLVCGFAYVLIFVGCYFAYEFSRGRSSKLLWKNRRK